jgi:hypothetical protein
MTDIPEAILSKAREIYESAWPDPVTAIAEALMEANTGIGTAHDLISDWLGEGTEDLPDDTAVRVNIGGRCIISEKLGDLRAAINPRTMSPEALEAHVKELQSIVNENREIASW